MGGPGSGRRLQFGRDTVDEYKHLDVLRWQREGDLRPGRRFSWRWGGPCGEERGSISVACREDAVRLSYVMDSGTSRERQVSYDVPIAWTACHFGGRRPWFVCPGRGCGRRVLHLYLRGDYFLCRHCHDLTYSSRQEGSGHAELLRVQRVRERLGGHPGLSRPFPEKPKGMHWRTYERLRRQAIDLEWVGREAIDRRLVALAQSFVRLLGG
jgi:hypothetical protein